MIFRPRLENWMHVFASIVFHWQKKMIADKEMILLEFMSNCLASSSLTDGTVQNPGSEQASIIVTHLIRECLAMVRSEWLTCLLHSEPTLNVKLD